MQNVARLPHASFQLVSILSAQAIAGTCGRPRPMSGSCGTKTQTSPIQKIARQSVNISHVLCVVVLALSKQYMPARRHECLGATRHRFKVAALSYLSARFAPVEANDKLFEKIANLALQFADGFC